VFIIKIKKNYFYSLFLTLILIVVPISFSFEFTDVLNAWKERGYAITEKGDYKIVEFRFNYDTVATLDVNSRELIIYTYTGTPLTKPDPSFISDIRKTLNNSAIDGEISEAILMILSATDYSFGKEELFANYRLKTTIYDNNSVILQLNHHVSATDISEQIDVEENKQLKEKIGKLEEQVSKLQDEINRLISENESKTRTIERLESKTTGLEASLEKYKNLSEYKENITDNLQKTIERYKEIERQKIEELEFKTAIIDDRNNQIEALKTAASKKEREMNLMIEALENRLKSMEEENKLLRENEEHYRSRLYRLNSLYNLQISETAIPVEGPVTMVENPTPEEPISDIEPATKTIKNENEATGKESFVMEPIQKDTEKPEKETIENSTEEKNEQGQENRLPSKEKVLKSIKYYNHDTLSHQISYEYNENGKSLKEIISLPNGNIVSTVENRYYENGNLYEKITCQNNKMIGKAVYQYNKEGIPIRIFIYDSTSIKGYQTYEYDPEVSKETPAFIKHYENNQLKMTEINTFDSEGNLVRTEQRDPDDQLLSFTVFEIVDSKPVKSVYFLGTEMKYKTINHFDAEENIISQETFDATDKIISKAEFLYE
jgi:hypothetical protein